jgi:hypothetical protein
MKASHRPDKTALIFLNKLLDISAAQIYSPSIGISKIIKDIGELGEIFGPKILRAWTC